MASRFAAGITMVSRPDVAQPPSARLSRKAPTVAELDAIDLPTYGLTSQNGSSKNLTATTDGEPNKGNLAKTQNDLERSNPSTPQRDGATGVMPTFSSPPMNRWRVLSVCGEYFVNGMNDSAPGPLLPYIEQWYGIGYAVVSTIWISNAVGFILAAFVSDLIRARLGRARSLMLSELLCIIAYVVIACPVPFPVVVVCYMVIGFGQAVTIALNNVFLANLANSTVLLGAGHGSYGIGGTVAPIMVTAMVANGLHWSRFFLIAIGFRVINLVAVRWSFKDYEKEAGPQFSNALEQVASRQAADSGEANTWQAIGRALKKRTTVIGAIFIFAYQGAEVAEAGWVITYLIEVSQWISALAGTQGVVEHILKQYVVPQNVFIATRHVQTFSTAFANIVTVSSKYRHGDPKKVGYVTSGFWAGLTIGRFVLTHFTGRVGEKNFVAGMTLGCLAFQLLVWFVPNIIGEAVAVAIIGLLIGPVYPCAQTVFTRLLPGHYQVFAIGFISSMGSSGGAIVPFVTGLIAQAASTVVLHPICIFCFIWMLVCWACLPKLAKRRE